MINIVIHPLPGRLLQSPVDLKFLIIAQILVMSISPIKLSSYRHLMICAMQQPFATHRYYILRSFP